MKRTGIVDHEMMYMEAVEQICYAFDSYRPDVEILHFLARNIMD